MWMLGGYIFEVNTLCCCSGRREKKRESQRGDNQIKMRTINLSGKREEKTKACVAPVGFKSGKKGVEQMCVLDGSEGEILTLLFYSY